MRRSKKDLVILVAVALFTRLLLFSVVASHPERAVRPDTSTYVAPAVQTLQNGGHYPTLDSHRTPGYPLFIALVYAVAGQRAGFVLVGQLIIDTLSVLLTYFLGRRLMSRRAAFVGALLTAMSLEMVTASMVLLTETLFTFLMVSSLLALTLCLQQRSMPWLIVSALLLGLASLTRPVALFLPIALVPVLIFGSQEGHKQRLLKALVFLLIFGLALAPWLIRNTRVVGAPTLSSISNYNLLFYNATALEANLRGLSEASVRNEMKARVTDYLQAHGLEDTELNRANAESALASGIILAHPGRYIFVHLKADLNNLLPNVTDLTELLGLTAGGKGTASVLNQYGIWAAVNHYFGNRIWLALVLSPFILLLGLVYLADIVGSYSLLRRHKFFAMAILLLPIFYFILLPGAPSLPRFRVPVWPYICLLAGVGSSLVHYLILVQRRHRLTRHAGLIQPRNREISQ